MNCHRINRRNFLEKSSQVAIGVASGGLAFENIVFSKSFKKHANNLVSIAKIKKGNISAAVEEAIDQLGGIETITNGKQKIMLKPNLVMEVPAWTTKPEVIQALARLLKKAGKEVLIGEGSSVANGFNIIKNEVYRTKRYELLNRMQKFVFDQLGYTKLAKTLNVPLVNLHSGDLVVVENPDAYVFKKLHLHHTLEEIDMLCSVPMMKTNLNATVTLGMKNLMGCSLWQKDATANRAIQEPCFRYNMY